MFQRCHWSIPIHVSVTYLPITQSIGALPCTCFCSFSSRSYVMLKSFCIRTGKAVPDTLTCRYRVIFYLPFMQSRDETKYRRTRLRYLRPVIKFISELKVKCWNATTTNVFRRIANTSFRFFRRSKLRLKCLCHVNFRLHDSLCTCSLKRNKRRLDVLMFLAHYPSLDSLELEIRERWLSNFFL